MLGLTYACYLWSSGSWCRLILSEAYLASIFRVKPCKCRLNVSLKRCYNLGNHDFKIHRYDPKSQYRYYQPTFYAGAWSALNPDEGTCSFLLNAVPTLKVIILTCAVFKTSSLLLMLEADSYLGVLYCTGFLLKQTVGQARWKIKRVQGVHTVTSISMILDEYTSVSTKAAASVFRAEVTTFRMRSAYIQSMTRTMFPLMRGEGSASVHFASRLLKNFS
jgi:hypothetical protein